MAAVNLPSPETLLAPAPRRLEQADGFLDLRQGLRLELDCGAEEVAAAIERLRGTLADSGVDLGSDGPPLLLEATAQDFAPLAAASNEGYRLDIDRSGIRLRASSGAGLSHGLATLGQWIRIHFGPLAQRGVGAVRIVDAPALPNRGVMLDVSRSRVPTMECLRALVDQLADWKINQLQLYFEHSFAYRGHEDVWQGTSPITPTEAGELDEYCARRHIELVPNQNSFGHLHRWLEHPRYRSLAECPDGIDHPFADRATPFSLCPLDPGSLELLADLFDQLLPNFKSRQLHIGFDETMDLGTGRSRQRAEEVGIPRLYSDFLSSVSHLARDHGRVVQFWGDIVAKYPQLLQRIPPDAIAMEWGYEASHPFTDRARALRDAGVPYYLCPGTSSWLSLAGRWSNAVGNIQSAAEAASRLGAAGLLVTDWGDQGHLQPPVVSTPAFLLSAMLSWNPAVGTRLAPDRLEGLLGLHAFRGRHGKSAAHALLELGDLYGLPGGSTFNGSPLFYLLTRPDFALDHPRFLGLSLTGLARCWDRLADLEAASHAAGEQTLWVHQALKAATQLGIDRLTHGASVSCRELPAARRKASLVRLDQLLVSYRSLWAQLSRPGGLEESVRFIERTRDALKEPERPI